LLVEVQFHNRTAGTGSLDDVHVAIINREGETHNPFAKYLLDPRWERHLRVNLGTVQIASGQRDDRHRFVCLWRRDPSGVAVATRGAVAGGGVQDRGALTWSLGIELCRALLRIIVRLEGSPSSKTGDGG